MTYAHIRPAGRRLSAFAVVGLLHVVLIYALINGLARRIVEVVHPPIEARIIEETKPSRPETPPPPIAKPVVKAVALPRPLVVQPKAQAPVPVQAPVISAPTPVQQEAASPASAAAAGSAGSPAGTGSPAGSGAGTAPQVRKSPVVRADSCETPSYPAASLRAGETGVVTLRFLIDLSGKVIESGIERLKSVPNATPLVGARCRAKA